MRSVARRRVSSLVRARVAPAGASFPLISTSGGFPGEKNRSLIFGEVLSIAARSSGVDIGVAAVAAAAAARGADGAIFGAPFVGEDIGAVASLDNSVLETQIQVSEKFAMLWLTFRLRSEERRVGKEGRSRWAPYH